MAAKVPYCVYQLSVDRADDSSVLPSRDIKKWDVAMILLMHGELDAAVEPVEVSQEEQKFFLCVWPYGFLHIPKPYSGSEVNSGDSCLKEFLYAGFS